MVGANLDDRLVGVSRLPDDAEPVAEVTSDSAPPDRMVVGEDDGYDSHRHTSAPSPGWLRTSTRPPASVSRPRIDCVRPTPSGVAATSKPLPLSFTEQNTPRPWGST